MEVLNLTLEDATAQVKKNLYELTEGFIAALFFADSINDERLDLRYDMNSQNLNGSCREEIEDFIRDWCKSSVAYFNLEELAKYYEENESQELTPLMSLGADIYFTCQGHGVGFWDRDFIPKELGEIVSDYCRNNFKKEFYLAYEDESGLFFLM